MKPAFSRTLRFCLYSLIFCVGLISSFVFYEAKLAKSPLTYPVLPVQVMTTGVKQGDTITTYVQRCNSSKETISYVIGRSLVSTDGTYRANLISNPVTLAPGCQRIVVSAATIPENTPPGFYIIDGVSTVHGKYRDFVVPWTSNAFEVHAKCTAC